MHRLYFLLFLLGIALPLHAQHSLPWRFFAEGTDKALFKVSATLQEYRLSGMLIVKKLPSGEIRAVMTMETGIKVYDVSVDTRRIRINESMRMYKNPFLKNILYRDLRLLISLPELGREIQKDDHTLLREGKWQYRYEKQSEQTYSKTRMKGKKACERAAAETDAAGVLQKSVHDFGGFPYRAEYHRLSGN
ncbi:MAG: hypothetical protein IBJ09_02555 [Bacteroidia bacterium]|nr:hypothetical protein [Bacteroidia bacterium]